MKIKKNLLLLVGLTALCLTLTAYAGELDNFYQAQDLPVYNAPAQDGSMVIRSGGTNRAGGGSNEGLSSGLLKGLNTRKVEKTPIPSQLMAVAPEHVGFTSNAQPVLRWYISGAWDKEILFTMNEVGSTSPDPVAEAKIDGPDKEGIYQIRLADYNVTLKPGVDYEYFLSIVVNEKERSGDVVSSAAIRYVEPSKELTELLKNTPKEKAHYAYAENGYYYDAVASVSNLIDANPNDEGLRVQRGALLAQVKLGNAAVYDSAVYKPFLKDMETRGGGATRGGSGP
jgi:hypothetical protein